MPQPSHSSPFVHPTLDTFNDALRRSISTTFEEMVFMDIGQGEEFALMNEQVYSRLEVREPVPCVLTVELSDTLVDACIDALYCGIESSDAVRQDLANELTNTIAGLLMSNLDESAPIALGLPSGARGTPEAMSGRLIVQTYQTDVGSLRATVTLFPVIG